MFVVVARPPGAWWEGPFAGDGRALTESTWVRLKPFTPTTRDASCERPERVAPVVLPPRLLLPQEPMLRLHHLIQARLNGGQFGGTLAQFPLEDVSALGEPDAVGCGDP